MRRGFRRCRLARRRRRLPCRRLRRRLPGRNRRLRFAQRDTSVGAARVAVRIKVSVIETPQHAHLIGLGQAGDRQRAEDASGERNKDEKAHGGYPSFYAASTLSPFCVYYNLDLERNSIK